MNARKVVPVVIPYYKNKHELTQCLAALDGQIGVETETFIRDNSDDNIFYTAAINEGLKRFAFEGNYDFILVLTQDAYLAKNALDKLVSTLELDEKIGIAAPIQINPNKQITWAGSLDAYPWGRHNVSPPSQNTPFKTFWINGACFLVRISMIREIGLLDQNMTHIFSDVDYSFTAKLRGWELVVVPDAICEHYLKSSAQQASFELEIIKAADQLYFASKWINGKAYRALSYEGPNLFSATAKKEFINTALALKKMIKTTDKNGVYMQHKVFSLLKNHL